MHNKARKNSDSLPDFQAIQVQLAADFEVHQHLRTSLLQHNNQEHYAKLLNNLICNKNKRTRLLKQLRDKPEQPQPSRILSADMKLSRAESSRILKRKQAVEEKFKEVDDRLCQQTEIQAHLQRQIKQTKKTLDLLKGDIGHLIRREQSAHLLGSKVIKAKIVAEDQLKKVSMALAKDKQELKIRNEMQRGFSKKLKNLSSHQTNCLIKAKQNFASSAIRHQITYTTLEKVRGMAFKEEEIARRAIKKMNIDTRIDNNLRILVQIKKIIEDYHRNKEASISVYEFENNIKERLIMTGGEDEKDLAEIADYSQISDQAVRFYEETEEAGINMTTYYNDTLKLREELRRKLWEQESEIYNIMQKFEIESLQRYKIPVQDKVTFHKKIKQFTFLLKAQYKILSYLFKFTRGTETEPQTTNKYEQFDNYIKSNSGIDPKNHFDSAQKEDMLETDCQKINSTWSQFTFHPIQIPKKAKNRFIKQVYNDFITNLHDIFCYINSHQVPQDDKSQCLTLNFDLFYKNMQENIKEWFNSLKNRFSKEFITEIIQNKLKTADKNKTTSADERSSRVHSTIQNNQAYLSNSLKAIPLQPINRINQPVLMKANRTKLIQNIDIDYYKMIKSTLKMEKENTRKNYQFLRTFKRTKFASRDALLQEKRFQASFSVLSVKNKQPSRQESQIDRIHSNQVSQHSALPSPYNSKKLIQSRRSIKQEQFKRSHLTRKLQTALSYY